MSTRYLMRWVVGLLVGMVVLFWLTNAARADRQRLTHAGLDGDIQVDALRPAISYNTQSAESLVLWVANERVKSGDIFAQRIDATGATVGDVQLISQRTSDPLTEPLAQDPVAVYNATDNQWLALWVAEADVVGELEIFGRILSSTAIPVSAPIRISQMGATASPAFDVLHPAIAWDSLNNQYLAVWQADHSVDNKSEIYAQLLTATGQPVGARQQISMSVDPTDINTGNFRPAVSFDASTARFSVVWNGGDALYGRQVSVVAAATLQLDALVQLTSGKAAQPHLASGTSDALLVYTAKQADTFHAYAQPLNADLSVAGAALQLSDTNAGEPTVAFDAPRDQYVLAWRHEGGTRLARTVDIALRTLDVTSSALGATQTVGRPAWATASEYLADHPVLIADNGQFTVVWQADGDLSDEFEIYVAQLQASVPTAIQFTELTATAPVRLLTLASLLLLILTMHLFKKNNLNSYASGKCAVNASFLPSNMLPRLRRGGSSRGILGCSHTPKSPLKVLRAAASGEQSQSLSEADFPNYLQVIPNKLNFSEEVQPLNTQISGQQEKELR